MIRARQVLVVTERADDLAILVAALEGAGFRVQVAAGLEGDLVADLAIVDTVGGALWPVAEVLAGGRLVVVVDGPAGMRQAFALGAEDCFLPAAHPDEVVARVEAVLRRTGSPATGSPPGEAAVYADRRLWVNFASRQVWVAGRPAQLTPREFKLLRFFLHHRNEVLSHEDILASVWGRSLDGGRPTEVLKQYIWRLRQKVEVDPQAPESILTVPGAGYQFLSRES